MVFVLAGSYNQSDIQFNMTSRHKIRDFKSEISHTRVMLSLWDLYRNNFSKYSNSPSLLWCVTIVDARSDGKMSEM